jgi:hypothetical protein
MEICKPTTVSDFPLTLRINPNVVVMDVVKALATHGLTLRTDTLGRTWVEEIPSLIRARG